MSSNNAGNLKSLFAAAHADGELSAASLQALNVPDIGARIQAGLGVDVDAVEASEVTLVTMLIDDSGSIRFGSNADLVREGHNTVLDALGESKQKEGILVHTRYLNGTILFPYCPLDGAEKMTPSNYDPNGGTPLYEETVATLGTVVAKAKRFSDNGVPARSITLIVSDGADSTCGSPKKAKALVTDLLKGEQNIVAAMGIDDGGSTDFRAVFASMGIPDEWILTPGNTKGEIRKAFRLFSQSAVRVSQGAAVGGFGTP